ncbi:hypothetical protein [Hyalangium sp.]|uniref:hypothetical protein n=1 Tax=Hyalangium sp. TaxID=2028555 RepID=UPI002D683FD0|nr:hypothetical protein [Hyalangium sp.]HYI01373.1 hypothetical protein [Hyalangium sp.]
MTLTLRLFAALSIALAGCNAPEEQAASAGATQEELLAQLASATNAAARGPEASALSSTKIPEGGWTESENRDRLLDTLAAAHGRADRCAEWASMGPNQQGVFLTLTDLMYGTYMYPPPYKKYLYNNSAQGNCVACLYDSVECRSGYECETNGKTCLVYAKPSPYASYPVCMSAPATDTYTVQQPRTGASLEKMLDHVTRIYSMAAETGSCGGSNNRMYFSVDDTLMYSLRNLFSAPVGWRNSGDLSGPHSPFTQSRETHAGQPRGQTHQFAWDTDAVWVQKPGMSTPVFDPHLVELDLDYNWIHDSNPECYYGGEYGRTRYTNFWRSHGYPGDLSYQPVCP